MELFELEPRDVVKAYSFLRGKVVRTPLERSALLSEVSGREVFLKLELLQPCRSFKLRGAINALGNLPREVLERGVITCSSGNHGQGVAMAARALGVKASVVVPEDCPRVKKEAIRRFGGPFVELIEHGRGYDEAHARALELAGERGLFYLPPGEHTLIMAGAGTVGLEMLEDRPELDCVVVPAGSGGLIVGIATVVKALSPSTRVIGVQSEVSPQWVASWREGSFVEVVHRLPTLAEGTWGSVERGMFELARGRVDDFFAVSEEEIAFAMAFALRELHLVVEGAGALPLALLLSHPELVEGKEVGLVVSGGNVEESTLRRVLQASPGRA